MALQLVALPRETWESQLSSVVMSKELKRVVGGAEWLGVEGVYWVRGSPCAPGTAQVSALSSISLAASPAWKCVSRFSHVRLLATPWAIACQAPLFLGFSRQEYWSGLPFPSPGDLPDPGLKLGSPALQADSLPSGTHSQGPGPPAGLLRQAEISASEEAVTCSGNKCCEGGQGAQGPEKLMAESRGLEFQGHLTLYSVTSQEPAPRISLVTIILTTLGRQVEVTGMFTSFLEAPRKVCDHCGNCSI